MSTEQPQDQLPEFWDWSLKVYDISGVPDTLLCLQDEFGLNVNLVLWCLWAGEYYPGLGEDQTSELLASTVEWHRRVTIPLRDIRRDMKELKNRLPKKDLKGVRREVKNLELESERVEQNYLAEATRKFADYAAHTMDTANHALYFKRYRQLAAKLEPAGNLGLEQQSERLKALFAQARDLIFLKEPAQPDV